jgi:putative transposase
MLTLSRMYLHKNIRLHAKNYLGQIAVFATLCCYERQRRFDTPRICLPMIDILRDAATTRRFAVHAYCFMPDHLHLLVEGLTAESDFLNFMKTFRIRSSRHFTQSNHSSLWQKKFFDHILRSCESLESVSRYIWLNPVRTGLAKELGVYPFAGSFTGRVSRICSAQGLWIPPGVAKSPPQKAASTNR